MRILYIVNVYPLLTQTFIDDQISGMLKRGHDVEIISLKKPKENLARHEQALLNRTTYLEKIPKQYFKRIIRVTELFHSQKGRKNLRLLYWSMNFFKYGREAISLHLSFLALLCMNKKPYDIIHCQFGTIAPIAIRLRDIGALKGKIVTSIRGFDLGQIIKDITGDYKELPLKVDLFLPVCSALKEQLLKIGCPAQHIIVMYGGINYKEIPFSTKLPNNGMPVRILSVGRLVEKKGFTYAIQAIRTVIQSGEKIEYKIIGDGVLFEELSGMIRELNIEKYVTIVGWKTHREVIGQLQLSDLLLAPSITTESGNIEGIPNILKEAMAAGLPVISTQHSGIPELIEDGKSGFIVPERDAGAIAGKIFYLIKNRSVWKDLSINGRKMIENKFDTDKQNHYLDKIYSTLVYN